jgi:hypothetical protein
MTNIRKRSFMSGSATWATSDRVSPAQPRTGTKAMHDTSTQRKMKNDCCVYYHSR